MIYNQELTNKIIDVLGEEFRNSSKSVIRCELEDALDRANSLIVNSYNEEIILSAIEYYGKIKKVDDEFMEYYMEELTEKELN